MNTTLLAGYFFPEASADTHLNLNLSEDLSISGMNVNVVVPFPSRGLDEKQKEKYETLRLDRINNNLTVHRVGQKGKYKKGLVLRGLRMLLKSFRLYSAAWKIDTDCYIVTSTPPFLGYFAVLLAKKAPVVYKLQDVFPDSLITVKDLSENNLVVKILRRLETKVYNASTRILVCSEDVKKTLISRSVDDSKIIVVHDWVDQNVCLPVDRVDNVLFDEYGISRDDFIFSYAGNIGYLQNVNTILDAAKLIKDVSPQIRIVIIGDGVLRTRMIERVNKERISNVVVLPMQPLDKVSQVYSLGSVELVSLKSGVTKTSLPSKAWCIMSAGRPLICEIDLESELASIVNEMNCGRCVAPGDASGLANAMLDMYYSAPADLARWGDNGRKYITACQGREISTAKIKAVIEDIALERQSHV